jgi:hypothetical protein
VSQGRVPLSQTESAKDSGHYRKPDPSAVAGFSTGSDVDTMRRLAVPRGTLDENRRSGHLAQFPDVALGDVCSEARKPSRDRAERR